jgi:hypothetical protein
MIPNNTALDRTITKVLQGLIALVNELAENSVLNDLHKGWIEKWFGK